MEVGTVAAGRIGLAVLRRLKPFDVKLHYTDRHRLPENVEKELGVTYHPNVESMVRVCDVVTINAPLHPETEHLFNDALISKMKRGAYLVNTARGRICDRDALSARWRADGSPATPVTSGIPSRRRRITPGGRCPITADAAHLGNITVRTGTLRRRDPGDPGMLVRGSSGPRGVFNRGSRQAGRCGCAFL
jgi:hypothetical protein